VHGLPLPFLSLARAAHMHNSGFKNWSGCTIAFVGPPVASSKTGAVGSNDVDVASRQEIFLLKSLDHQGCSL
jgi:hypothetical protein